MTSEEQLKRSRAEINATNNRRAKQMERRIAHFLQGSRTPMSGAAAKYKGDVSVDFVNNPGKYIIECKLSAAISSSNQPKIDILLKWFAKIQQEATAMRARFGILVIHYHNTKEDYVFLRKDHLDWIFTKSTYSAVIDKIISTDIPARDIMRFANGKLRTLFEMERRKIEDEFIDIDGFKTTRVNTPDGTYYIFTLTQFRDLLEGV